MDIHLITDVNGSVNSAATRKCLVLEAHRKWKRDLSRKARKGFTEEVTIELRPGE